MENQTNDLDIPTRAAATPFDPKLFDGQRVPVDSVEKLQVVDYYPEKSVINSESGLTEISKEYDFSSTKKKWVIEIITKPLHKVTLDANGYPKVLDDIMSFTKDGKDVPLVIRERFNLQSEIKDDGTEEVYISKHPKASLWKFMRKLEVDTLSEIKDKLVTITTTPSKKDGDDRLFLTIAR
jgi:hypothetical protein